jgi:hypothetical protein
MNSLAVIVPAVNSLDDLLGCPPPARKRWRELECSSDRLGEASSAAIRTEARGCGSSWSRETAIPQMRARLARRKRAVAASGTT